MKICIIGAFPEKEKEVRGGVANVILYLATALVQHGHCIHIITTGKSEKSYKYTAGFVVHVIKIPSIIPRYISNMTMVNRKIIRKIEGIKPDICHFHGSAIYMMGCKAPSVLTLHGVNELDLKASGKSWFKAKITKHLEGFFRKKAKNIILINNYLEEVIGGDLLGRKWTIENPVSNIFFDVERDPKSVIFYAGMLSKRKNILLLLKAFKMIVDKGHDVRLKLAGPERESDYLEMCKSYIKENKLDNRIDFIGELNSQEIASELSHAICSVLVSKQETAPLFIGESMAAGVPVVAVNVGGVRYLIRDKVTGIIASSHDEESIADSISYVLEDESRRNIMGENAKEEAFERFNVESIAQKTIKVYESIINTESGLHVG